MRRIVEVAAHRGAALLAPGNTAPAFRKAAELGADMIEIDARTTADGELVVIHNDTVDGTTDGVGRVQDLTLTEIRSFDAGAGYAPRFRGTKVPTLAEALGAIGALGLQVNIDIKAARVEAIVEEVESLGLVDATMISSPDHAVLREARQLCPSIRILAMGLDPAHLGELVDDLRPDALNFNRHTLNAQSYSQVMGKGVTIYQSILGENDNAGGIMKSVELGADILETDRILETVQTLAGLGRR